MTYVYTSQLTHKAGLLEHTVCYKELAYQQKIDHRFSHL